MTGKIYFENEQGRVEMFPGGTGPVRVSALSGLGNPKKIYNTVTFSGKPGQKTLSSVAQARSIIISGDICGDRTDVENIMRVLDTPGRLVLEFENKIREIFCNQVEFEEGTRHGGYTNFVLTLVADGVYFTDPEPTKTAVFKRENLLEGDIVFPCVFTRKTTQATVENYGEINSEPVIYIYNLHKGDGSIAGGITLENVTTGQKIKIETAMEENEKITVNIADRKITSSLRGNITNLISDDTFLNKFWLAPGENLLVAHHGNVGEEISVVCSSYSNYREAIF